MDRIKSYMILALVLLGTTTSQAQLTSPDALKLALVMEKVSRYYVDSINDTEVVEEHRRAGRNVIDGDCTDMDFWGRAFAGNRDKVQMVILIMFEICHT